MSKLRSSIVALLLASFFCTLVSAQTATLSEERQKALFYVTVLETQPGSPEAKGAAAWLTVWLIEVEDLTVHVCPEILGPAKKTKKLPATLSLQHMYSQAAYQIQHPEVAEDSLPVYLEGVRGTLRTYRAMKDGGSKKKYDLLEELLVLEEEDQLEAYVAKQLKECR